MIFNKVNNINSKNGISSEQVEDDLESTIVNIITIMALIEKDYNCVITVNDGIGIQNKLTH